MLTRNTIDVVAVERRLRGRSGAHLVRADDGNFYVMKPLLHEDHLRRAVVEWIVAGLFQLFKVSTPSVHPLSLNGRAENGSLLPAECWNGAKLHFGSKLPVNPFKRAIWDFLPTKLLPTVQNRGDFLKVLVLDHLLGKTTPHQAFFARVESGGPMQAYFIDHKDSLSGIEGKLSDNESANALTLRLQSVHQYFMGSEEALDDFYDDLNQISLEKFMSCLEGLPSCWLPRNDENNVRSRLRSIWKSRVRPRAARLAATSFEAQLEEQVLLKA